MTYHVGQRWAIGDPADPMIVTVLEVERSAPGDLGVIGFVGLLARQNGAIVDPGSSVEHPGEFLPPAHDLRAHGVDPDTYAPRDLPDRAAVTEIGCHLDNHRGHYITRDMIDLARSLGFIVGEFERWALETYQAASSVLSSTPFEKFDYPHEALIELADEALAWLNAEDDARVKGQNLPPLKPRGFSWQWNDGDFGLYKDESYEGCESCGSTLGADPDFCDSCIGNMRAKRAKA